MLREAFFLIFFLFESNDAPHRLPNFVSTLRFPTMPRTRCGDPSFSDAR